MPESDFDMISKESLQMELRSGAKNLIILDCRSSNEYIECHIRSAVNFSIPTIMLRRLSAGKIDLISTIKSKELKERFELNYKLALFVLYNDNCYKINNNKSAQEQQQQQQQQQQFNNNSSCNNDSSSLDSQNITEQDVSSTTTTTTTAAATATATKTTAAAATMTQSTINVLHKRLKQDGCKVVCLEDGFTCFRNTFPEWCEDDCYQIQDRNESSLTPCIIGAIDGQAQTEQLMGLRSLRISTPHSDSACSSSAESSDCESTTYPNFNDEPVEIVPGLFLGNASHSSDLDALKKYNIKYVLNVTPDLPNVFEASGGIKYLQIPIADHYSQDLAVHFPVAIQFIDEAQTSDCAVLVHCLAGVSRSVTITLAYLMSTRGLNLNEAFNLVRDRKPDVSPNFHFMEQLHSFERQLRLQSDIENNESNLNESMHHHHHFHHHHHHHHLHHRHHIIPSTSRDTGIMLTEEEDEEQDCRRTQYGENSEKISKSYLCTCHHLNTSGPQQQQQQSSSSSPSSTNTNIMSSSPSSTSSPSTIIGNCKCNLDSAATQNFLASSNVMTSKLKATGVSPDSGIEFDRWAPSSDGGLK